MRQACYNEESWIQDYRRFQTQFSVWVIGRIPSSPSQLCAIFQKTQTMNNSSGKKSTEGNSIEAKGVNSPKEVLGKTAERWLARNRSLVLRQTPIWAQSLVGIVITLGVTAIAAGTFFRIDEVITVQGQLEAISGKTKVKTPIGGKISQTFFKDGEVIKKGQLLVRFDTRQAQSDQAISKRLIDLEHADLRDKLEILSGKEEVLSKKIITSQSITNELSRLVTAGGFQKVQYLQQMDELYELKNQLSNVKLEKNRTKLEAEKSIGQLQNQLKQAELRLQYQNVVAPISGIVFDPQARVDGVIGGGDTILTIIPQKGLIAQVFVTNKDIGFIKKGQKTQVRIDAFPFTKYGEMQGNISQIGADALPPNEKANFYRYPVKISIDKPYLQHKGAKIPLRSGMAITANIKLRDKRVISLISDMLVDQTDSIRSIRQQ